MDPATRYVLAIVGALLGSRLGLVGALAGAGFGFLGAEIGMLRARLKRLEGELSSLRRRGAALGDGGRDAPAAPVEVTRETVAAALATPVLSAARVKEAEPTPVAAAARDHPQPPALPAPVLAAIRRVFLGGNTLVRLGVIVLFFGVAFLLRYVAERTHVPVELRLAGVALGAIALLLVGWRLRERRAGYAFALQGGAVGILYLTTFAALRLYALLPPALAFTLLALIAVLSAMLAILQNSQAFALLGTCGGFLAPVLAATGQGSHVVLFSYFAVLNAGILGLAWFRAWRALNLLGFVFTFGIATAWGVLRYQPADFITTEPFLLAFFLFYVAIAVLFARRPEKPTAGYVDGTLLFGTPMVAFALQTAMLRQDSLALAFSALGVSAVYLGIAAWLARRRDAAQAVLLESCLAIGVVFLTLAVPLALGNRLNAAAWALEGAGLTWIGCRQSRRLARALGLLLITAAAGLVLEEVRLSGGTWQLPPASFAGVVLASGAGMFAAWSLARVRTALDPWERLHAPWLFLVGLSCWCIGTLGELPHAVSGDALVAAALAVLALTAGLLAELGQRSGLVYAVRAALALPAVLWLFALIDSIVLPHWFAAGGWAAWLLGFALQYRILRQHESSLGDEGRRLQHASTGLLACVCLSEEADWLVRHAAALHGDWAEAARVLPPALALLLLPRLVQQVRWPFAANRDAYIGRAALALALLLSLWSLARNLGYAGDSAPLPYLPLLNPFDLAQILSVIALYRLLRHLAAGDPRDAWRLPPGAGAATLAAVVFVWCNGVLLRTLHHLLGIAIRLDVLFASTVVETSLSIFWSVLALITMLVASRRRYRRAWVAGAVLLAAVILKLFFIDLSSIGSIERIISFVGVGLLMLVIGYFSPLPPRSGEAS